MKYTLDELKEIQTSTLKSLLCCAGSVAHLSRMLNVPRMTVEGWVSRGRISKKGAQLVEDHETLGQHFKAVQLRPDLEN